MKPGLIKPLFYIADQVAEDFSMADYHSSEDDHMMGPGSHLEDDSASNRSTPAKSAIPRTAGLSTVSGTTITGRGVTLSMLMQDGIVEPGNGLLSISYLVSA